MYICNMREIILSKLNNIGSLCLFLNKNEKYIEYIENNIIDLSLYNLNTSQKLYYYINNI